MLAGRTPVLLREMTGAARDEGQWPFNRGALPWTPYRTSLWIATSLRSSRWRFRQNSARS